MKRILPITAGNIAALGKSYVGIPEALRANEGALDTLGLRRLPMAVTGILFLLIVLPVIIGWTAGFSPVQILGFVGTIFLLQGLSPTVGIGLGLPPFQLFGILTSVATGIILGIFMVCDLVSGKSERITIWTRKIDDIKQKYPVLDTLGEYMLIPLIWIPGIDLYGAPVIAWVLGSRSPRAVLFLLTGWLIACLAVFGTTSGVLTIFGL